VPAREQGGFLVRPQRNAFVLCIEKFRHYAGHSAGRMLPHQFGERLLGVVTLQQRGYWEWGDVPRGPADLTAWAIR